MYMELTEKELKSYKEYLQNNEDSIFFTLPFFKRLVENKVDLNEFTKVCPTYFYNHYFLEWYLAGELSENEKGILYDEFSADTHIELYRKYFSSVAEEISESKGVKTIELTAYGISKSQNRSVIAFRGVFKNDLLVSYESKIQNCEPYSYHRNDELNLTYTLTDQKILEEIIKHDYSEILDEERLNEIYSNEINDIDLIFKRVKELLDDSYYTFLGENTNSGLLVEEWKISSFHFTTDAKWYKLSDLKREFEFKPDYELTKKEGYYVCDFLDLFQKHVVNNNFYSEKIKKLSPRIYSKINFEQEKNILSEIQRLKTDSIEKAKSIENEKLRLISKKKKERITFLVSITLIFIVFLLILNYLL